MTVFSTCEWKNKEAVGVALARYGPRQKKKKLNEYEIYYILDCYSSIEQNYEVLFIIISLGGLGNY